MSEVDISPLAKRLAEENNVDWRKLRGSGAGGKVVERDVLEFLARVMSGQEDVDPTPEPLPEGMEEWPEEDIAAYRRGARERTGEPGAAQTPEEPVEEEIDEGIFLFEDDDVEPEPEEPEEEPEVFAVAGGDEIEEEDDLFLDLDDDEDEEAAAGEGRDFDVSVDLDAPSEARPQRGAVDLGDMGLDMGEEDAAEEAAPADSSAFDADLDFVGSEVVDEAPAGAVFMQEDDEDEAEVTAAEPEPAEEAPPSPPARASEGARQGLPLVRRGTLLRRHVDVTALKSAQAVLARELGHDEPLPLSAFLLRAAARAHHQHRLGEGGVALAMIEGGLTFGHIDDAGDGAFRDLVSALRSMPTSEDVPAGAALAVADLSELDVDEAILDASVPVLAFGRVLYDDQGGDVRGTLSLSGDVQPDVGGRLLAATADLLTAPVRLLV